MPRLTYLKSTAENRVGNELLAMIRYYQSMNNMTQGELAKKIRVTPQTFSNRTRNPMQTTLGELSSIFDVMNFSETDILKVFGRA